MHRSKHVRCQMVRLKNANAVKNVLQNANIRNIYGEFAICTSFRARETLKRDSKVSVDFRTFYCLVHLYMNIWLHFRSKTTL